MSRFKNFIKNLFTLYFTLFLIFIPVLNALAQEEAQPETNETDPNGANFDGTGNQGTIINTAPTAQTQQSDTKPGVTVNPDGQVQYDKPIGPTQPQNTAERNLAAGTLTCSAGELAGKIVGGLISEALGLLTSYLSNIVDATVGSIISTKVQTEDKNLADTNNAVGAKEAGRVSGGNILSGIIDIIGVPLDSIGFCIANELIRYIAQSTVQWIKSGFEGNPVFVDNPEQFFLGVADQEAASFLRQVVGETAGIDICQPFKIQLAIDTIGSHNRSYYGNRNRLSCSLSQIKDNYERFAGGDWSSGGLPGWFEIIRDENNVYGARYMAEEERLLAINKRQNNLQVELNWAKGYKNFKVCDGEKDKDGRCLGKERTTTMGGAIEHQLNDRLDSVQRRIEMADEFDEIVSALMEQLVRTAVNSIFEDENYGEDQSEGGGDGDDEGGGDTGGGNRPPPTGGGGGTQAQPAVIADVDPFTTFLGATTTISGSRFTATGNTVIFEASTELAPVTYTNIPAVNGTLQITITQAVENMVKQLSESTDKDPLQLINIKVRNSRGTSNEFYMFYQLESEGE